MSSEEPEQQLEGKVGDEKIELLPHYILPSSIQLHSIFAIEIMAKRYPVEIADNLFAQSSLQLEDIQLNQDNSHAQVVLNVQVGFSNEPHPFEISFKLLGLFTFQESNQEIVFQFLNQGSLSVMLPFARELLMSLCARLQVPPLILQMIQLAPPSSLPEQEKEHFNQ